MLENIWYRRGRWNRARSCDLDSCDDHLFLDSYYIAVQHSREPTFDEYLWMPDMVCMVDVLVEGLFVA
jgi:hypothetical protein